VLLACVAFLAWSPVAAGILDDSGQREYVRAGCDSCHGPEAHGAGQAPELAGLKRPYPEFVKIVRDGIGEMPPHSKDEVSDEQLGTIYKWLTQLPSKGSGRAISARGVLTSHVRRLG
jgi:mono/diheme cytochrome c family protein